MKRGAVVRIREGAIAYEGYIGEVVADAIPSPSGPPCVVVQILTPGGELQLTVATVALEVIGQQTALIEDT